MEKPKKRLEKDIQLDICKHLDSKGYFFWRQNTAGVFNKESKGFMRTPKYSRTGVPDIILIRNGCFIGLEVKSEHGRQSENQKAFQEGLEFAGGEYYIVRSVEDVKSLGL